MSLGVSAIGQGLLYGLIGLGLTLISALVGIVFVMRYEPLQAGDTALVDGAENGLRLYAQPAGTQALNTKENEL